MVVCSVMLDRCVQVYFVKAKKKAPEMRTHSYPTAFPLGILVQMLTIDLRSVVTRLVHVGVCNVSGVTHSH